MNVRPMIYPGIQHGYVQKKFACICLSNQNRSMEGHAQMIRNGIPNVSSFGTGKNVKLPGPTPTTPNTYPFGTPYTTIYQDLKSKDADFYTQMGLLDLLARNANIKVAPERFQDARDVSFDVILTYEERVFETVIVELLNRPPISYKQCHIINIETRDAGDEAVKAGGLSAQLAKRINSEIDLDDAIYSILDAFQLETERSIMHSIAFV
ncbi:putative RNA polymerase II subunit A C-terminal domain phosphatase SSU72 [Blattamonas nauphoetae]|uniref:RNA polymerase II subunit A C-terminal domain phosphatase SSU72 n=1 Tax=Blattamonas nauphoetae TaxID=2049346 RepID=A0ABQ9YF77_9EUKA|nr:putative RNA polymerase II subunit A C-terminal domain phosphatase SSU72 [Blattamonas nauphoetae]